MVLRTTSLFAPSISGAQFDRMGTRFDATSSPLLIPEDMISCLLPVAAYDLETGQMYKDPLRGMSS